MISAYQKQLVCHSQNWQVITVRGGIARHGHGPSLERRPSASFIFIFAAPIFGRRVVVCADPTFPRGWGYFHSPIQHMYTKHKKNDELCPRQRRTNRLGRGSIAERPPAVAAVSDSPAGRNLNHKNKMNYPFKKL